jgi:transcriptional regulator with XRE-family HTH domain
VEQDRRKADRETFQHRSIPLPALRVLRRSMAMSQRRLADRAAVSPNTVRLLEGGRRGAPPTTVRKLAQALGVAPAALAQGHRPDSEENASR